MDVLMWMIFWIGVNGVVGYAIGKNKNDSGGCVAVSILLGPIGWLISIGSKGNLRECPFCAEHVNPDAKVCRYCGRDLPAPALAPRPPSSAQIPDRPDAPAPTSPGVGTILTITLLVAVVIAVVIFFSAKGESNRAALRKENQHEQSAPLASPAQPSTTPMQSTPSETPAEMPTANAEKPTHVVLKQPIAVQLPYGNVVLSAGTELELVSKDATEVHIRYLGTEHAVPISVVD